MAMLQRCKEGEEEEGDGERRGLILNRLETRKGLKRVPHITSGKAKKHHEQVLIG